MEIDEKQTTGIVEGNRALDREKVIPINEKKKTIDLNSKNKAGPADHTVSQNMDNNTLTEDNKDKNLLKSSDKKTETLITSFLTRRGKSPATRYTTLEKLNKRSTNVPKKNNHRYFL